MAGSVWPSAGSGADAGTAPGDGLQTPGRPRSPNRPARRPPGARTVLVRRSSRVANRAAAAASAERGRIRVSPPVAPRVTRTPEGPPLAAVQTDIRSVADRLGRNQAQRMIDQMIFIEVRRGIASSAAIVFLSWNFYHQYNAFWSDQRSERDSEPCTCEIAPGYLQLTSARPPTNRSLTVYQI